MRNTAFQLIEPTPMRLLVFLLVFSERHHSNGIYSLEI